jgi:hypothetical protein
MQSSAAPFQDFFDRPRHARPAFRGALALTDFIGIFGATSRRLLDASFSRRRQIDAGSARFGQTDGDGLLRRARAMLALADLVYLVLDEFAGLSACRFTGTLVLPGFANDFLSWHGSCSL